MNVFVIYELSAADPRTLVQPQNRERKLQLFVAGRQRFLKIFFNVTVLEVAKPLQLRNRRAQHRATLQDLALLENGLVVQILVYEVYCLVDLRGAHAQNYTVITCRADDVSEAILLRVEQNFLQKFLALLVLLFLKQHSTQKKQKLELLLQVPRALRALQTRVQSDALAWKLHADSRVLTVLLQLLDDQAFGLGLPVLHLQLQLLERRAHIGVGNSFYSVYFLELISRLPPSPGPSAPGPRPNWRRAEPPGARRSGRCCPEWSRRWTAAG